MAPNVAPLLAEGRLRRALATLDGWRCPGGEHLAWAARVRLLARLGRVDEARALIAKIDATPWATAEMRAAAREAAKEPAPSKSGAELATEALASKSQALVDRAITTLERETGGTLQLDPPTRSRYVPLAVAFSPKGDRLALAKGDVVDVITVATWTLSARLMHPTKEVVESIAFTPDGSALVAATSAHVVTFGMADGKVQRTLEATAPVMFAAGKLFARKGEVLVAFDASWNAGPPIAAPHHFSVFTVSSDGRHAVFAKGPTLDVVDLTTGKSQALDIDNGLPGHAVISLAFSPDGQTFAAGQRWLISGEPVDGKPKRAGGVQIFDTASAKKIGEPMAKREVVSVAFSPDGKMLAGTGSLSGRVWSMERNKKGAAFGRELRKFVGHADGTLAIAWHPDGKRLASTSKDETVRVWDLETELDRVKTAKTAPDVGAILQSEHFPFDVSEHIRMFGSFAEPAHAAAIRGGTLAIAAGSNALYTFSFDGKPPRRLAHELTASKTLTPHGEEIRFLGKVVSVGFDPLGKVLAYGSDDGFLRVASQKPIAVGSVVEQLAFPSGDVVAVISPDGTARSYRVPEGVANKPHTPGAFARRALAFSPDGKVYVARATKGKTIHVVDTLDGTVRASFDGVDQPLASIAVSNDGKLVLAAKGKSVRLHGTDVSLSTTHDVTTLALDATKSFFAIGDDEGLVQWFAIDGKPLGQAMMRDRVAQVSFAGDRLVAASADGTTTVFSTTTHGRVLRAGTTGTGGAFLENAKGQMLLFGSARAESTCRVGALAFPMELCADELLVDRISLD